MARRRVRKGAKASASPAALVIGGIVLLILACISSLGNRSSARSYAPPPAGVAQAQAKAKTPTPPPASRLRPSATAVPTRPLRPTAPPPVAPVGEAQVVANLRSEPRVAPETVVGKLCPGDQLEYVGMQQVGTEVWYQVRLVAAGTDCASDRAEVGAMAWAAGSVISTPSSSVQQYMRLAGVPIPTTIPATRVPTAAPRPALRPQAPAQSSQCDPSYPGICIPVNSPDLDCGEIPYRRFQVVGADPHGFDRDRDGIGCES